MKKILFVGHDANRAGAQLLLLYWQQLLLDSNQFSFCTLLKNGGILESEYSKYSKVFVWNKPATESKAGRLKRAYEIIFPTEPHKLILSKLKDENFDIIISNTLTNGDILPHLSTLNIPIISYVHELAMHLEMYTTKIDLANTLKLSSHYLVCAKIAGENLVKNHSIDAQKITWIPTPSPKIDLAQLKEKEFMLKELGFGNDNKIIGCIGSVNLRKGVDLFVKLSEMLPTLNFVWIGGSRLEFMEVINLNSFPENLRFIPNTVDALSYLNCFDIYAQTSRMEVFPLSVMEAYSLKKPVICFEVAGGTKEIVGSDAGIVVEQLNLEEMAKQIKYLAENKELILEFGNNGFEKLKTHYAAENSLIILQDTINQILVNNE